MTVSFKQYAIFLSVFLTLFLMNPDAYALNIEVRAGAGDLGVPLGELLKASAEGSYQKVEIDGLVSPWRRLDLFAGVEYINGDNLEQLSADHAPVNYSLDAFGLAFGFRFKPFISERWQVYLALGGLAGKADYKADFDRPDLVALDGDRGSESFIVPRLGIGAVVGLNKRFGVGIEGAFTQSIPSFNFRVLNNSTGQVEVRKVNDGAQMFGITLGLRYSF